MKLKKIEHLCDYRFDLTFENGECIVANLAELFASHVGPDELISARIDPEWGCLEFKNGQVDIEPKTLYKFASAAHQRHAA